VLPVSFRDPLARTSPSPTTAVVIPARYDSTRLPGKPLADLHGEPMIVHVYRRAAAVPGVDAVIVATDDERVIRAIEDCGGTAVMTARTHRTGTDRVAEVAAGLDCDLVVNVQGDEPLVHPEMIAAVIAPLRDDPSLEMSTVCRPLTDPGDYLNPNVVKLVRDVQGRALYFSRSPIPHLRGPQPPLWKHFGLYGYRRDFLLRFAQLPATPLEQAESLEQLRALEHGFRIHAATTEHDSIGVDTPEDLDRARRQLAAADRHQTAVSGRDGRAHI
jgi:3-deoxy-manno-octulosonate cytidylyltransferase (CMP-KDO synthetase)